MSRYNNTFEGGTNGAAVSLSNSGGVSGSAWNVIVANGVGVSSSPNIVYSTDAAISGGLGCRMTLGAGATYLRKDADTTLGSRVFLRMQMTYPGPASTGVNTMAVIMAGSTRALSLVVGTDGRPFFALTNNGTYFVDPKPTNALLSGTDYTFEIVVGKASVAGATDGELGLRILSSSGTVIHSWTGEGNTGIDNYSAVRIGGATNGAGWTVLNIDDVSFGDLSSGWPTPITGTTTVVMSADTYYVADFRNSTSSTGNALAYAISWTSGADLSDEVAEPVEGFFLVPRASSPAVYTVTITDGTATTTRQVNVPAESGGGQASDAITEYYWNGTAWV